MTNNLIFKTVRELSALIADKSISPVEVTKTFLDRLEELHPTFNSVVTITKKTALEHAHVLEREILQGKNRGILHGIPYGAKDLLATKNNIPTTWGAYCFKDRCFDYEATVIAKLERQGAVLVAKLAMIELAGGMGYNQPNASFTGPCRNPWSLDAWSGGSSSGSGSAVGAGLVPFAIGSETWGSILSPANNCGVTGLRPTYGRVSRYGAMPLSWTLDKLGPLALSADDCGLILQAVSGPDPNDENTQLSKYEYVEQEPPKGKLAIIKGVADEADSEVRENFYQSVSKLEKWFDCEEIEVPDMPYHETTRIIMMAESASVFENFTEQGLANTLTAPEDKYGPYARTVVLAKDYIKALRIRRVMARNINDIMNNFDGFIAPTRNSAATGITEEFRGLTKGSGKDTMGAIGNVLGLPAISIPNGFTSQKLPTAIQIMGTINSENILLSIANKYQNSSPWHKIHPENLSA